MCVDRQCTVRKVAGLISHALSTSLLIRAFRHKELSTQTIVMTMNHL